MRHEIPDRWQDRVRQHLRNTAGDERGHLLAIDFVPGRSVRLGFPDGSYALFRYAFFLRDEALNEVAVFTEHCGYHFFPAAELEAELFESVWEGSGGDNDAASPV